MAGNAGSTSSNNSKQRTISDYAQANGQESIWFNGTYSGSTSHMKLNTGNGLRNNSNWSGTNTGTGLYTLLKNVISCIQLPNWTNTIKQQHHQYCGPKLGIIYFSYSSNIDTVTWLIVAENNSPSNPLDRYTCYTPNSNYLPMMWQAQLPRLHAVQQVTDKVK